MLDVCATGTFSGDEAKRIVNQLANRFHQEITATLRKFSRQDALRKIYQDFETTSIYAIYGESEKKQEKNELAVIYRYLVEAVINSGSESSGPIDRDTKARLARLTDCLVGLCYTSDYLHYSRTNDAVEVHETGHKCAFRKRI